MGKVIKSSSSPVPFPGIPIKQSNALPQPGEVLVRYEVEAAGGCQLNLLGWCCFGALLCAAFPLSWLPFICSECKKKYQRPVYGYPMHTLSFIPPDADAAGAGKPTSVGVTAPPAILCMDSSLEHEQQQQTEQEMQKRQASGQLPQPLQQHQQQSLPCSPSPPPMSIFVPPSLVPACGFTPEHPFPSRYSPVLRELPMYLQQGSPLSSPKCPAVSVLGVQPPASTAGGPGVGLPVMGVDGM